MDYELDLSPNHPARFMQKLRLQKSFRAGNVSTFSRYLVSNMTELFHVDSAGIWMLNEDKTKLTPYSVYSRRSKKFTKGDPITLDEYPNYFRYILRHQKMVADDVTEHPALTEFLDSYLIPNNVTSSLDVAIIEGRKIVGIMCLEVRVKKRHWKTEDVIVLSCLCTFFSNVMMLARKNIQERKMRELENKNNELSVALQHVMDLQRKGHQSLEENLSFNVMQKVAPLLLKLKQHKSTDKDLEILESYLKSLTSPFYRASHKLLNLSPQEHKIVELVKAGYQSKEIGRMLDLSEKTVQTHKKNIRRKLNIKGQKINLQTYLDQVELER